MVDNAMWQALREGLIDALDDACQDCEWFARGDNALWLDPISWAAFAELNKMRAHIVERHRAGYPADAFRGTTWDGLR